MTRDDIIARAEEALAHRPRTRYQMGSGPHTTQDLAEPWTAARADCSSFACWCAGIAKHDFSADPDIWWGTRAICADAHVGVRWQIVAFAVGVLVVYPGHMGVVVGGTAERPTTIESASSKGGLWRGRRPSLWRDQHALFVLPTGAE